MVSTSFAFVPRLAWLGRKLDSKQIDMEAAIQILGGILNDLFEHLGSHTKHQLTYPMVSAPSPGMWMTVISQNTQNNDGIEVGCQTGQNADGSEVGCQTCQNADGVEMGCQTCENIVTSGQLERLLQRQATLASCETAELCKQRYQELIDESNQNQDAMREQIKQLEQDVGRATARSQTSLKEQHRLCKEIWKLQEESFELEEELMKKKSKQKKTKRSTLMYSPAASTTWTKRPTKRIQMQSWRDRMLFKQNNRDVFASLFQSCQGSKFEVAMSERLQNADAYYGFCIRSVATGSVPESADPARLKEMKDEEEEEEYIDEETCSKRDSSEDEDLSMGKRILPWYAMA